MRQSIVSTHTELNIIYLKCFKKGKKIYPTPLASNIHHKKRIFELKKTGAVDMMSRKNGATRPNSLIDFIHWNGLWEEGDELNPEFVQEMMGFPDSWILKPFIDDKNEH